MRLIDADSLKKWVEEYHTSNWGIPQDELIYAIGSAQTIDPVKHGKWIPGREIAREMIDDTITAIIYEDWKCSDCGCTVEEGKPVWNYCPYCGAKMDGGEGCD